MTSATGFDYWYLRLPAGAKIKGKSDEERITDELTELAERGWEPVAIGVPSVLTSYFLLRKPTA